MKIKKERQGAGLSSHVYYEFYQEPGSHLCHHGLFYKFGLAKMCQNLNALHMF